MSNYGTFVLMQQNGRPIPQPVATCLEEITACWYKEFDGKLERYGDWEDAVVEIALLSANFPAMGLILLRTQDWGDGEVMWFLGGKMTHKMPLTQALLRCDPTDDD